MKNYLKKILILVLCCCLMIPQVQVFAFFDKNTTDAFKVSVEDSNIYIFNQDSSKGRSLASTYPQYTKWHIVEYGDSQNGVFRTFLPVHFNKNNMADSKNYSVLKAMRENRTNKYGQGGLYLVNSSDWNVKYGWDLPFATGENTYQSSGGNISLPSGKKGELRYIGYDLDGEPINNPYFPDDRASTENAWEKDWIPFGSGGMAEHKPSSINLYNQDMARKIFTEFFVYHETGQRMIKSYEGKKCRFTGESYSKGLTTGPDGKQRITEEAFQFWNKRFRIEQKESDPNIMITGNWRRKSDGHVLYQTFASPRRVSESTFIRSFKIVEEGKEDIALTQSAIFESNMHRMYGGAPISHISNKSFFGQQGGGSTRVAENEPPTLSLGGKYNAIGEIVFTKIDPDTSKDVKQGEFTKTQPPKIHFQYQYYDSISKKWYTVADGNTFNDYFKEGKTPVEPLVAGRDKASNVVGIIKWPHDIASSTKNYTWGRVTMEIPKTFVTNEDDFWVPDNFTFLEFKIAAGNDMAMKEPIILKNDQGKKIEGPEVGKDHVFEFVVDNLTDQTIDKPNTTIDIEIIDKTTDKPIYKDTIESVVPTGPKEETVIITPPISIPSNKIEACAIINIIHKEQGENLIPTNDIVCAEFGSQQDMEMGSTVKLKDRNGQEVNSIAPNENHFIEFIVKHVKGNVEVGTPRHNSEANPNATIDVEIVDANKKVIHKQTYETSQVLQPNGSIVIPTSRVINTSSPTITACAVINKKHDDKGFNIRTDRDRVCETFTATNNLSVKELKVSPNIVETDTATTVNKQITFDYSYAYDTTGNQPVNTVLTFRMQGQKMFEERVTIYPGQTLTGSKTGTVTMPSGGATFTLEINESKSHKEYLGNGKDAYADNKKTANVTRRVRPACINCENGTTKTNKWQEKITWTKTVGDAKTFYGPFKLTDQNGNNRSCDGKCTCPGTSSSGCHRDCDGHSGSHSSSCYSTGTDCYHSCGSYCNKNGCYHSCGSSCEYEYLDCSSSHTTYCSGCYTCHHDNTHYCSGHTFCVNGDWKARIVSESPQPYPKYYEEYGIKKVYYKSKWSQDKYGGDGWVEIKNGDRVKIKAGYPFEVKVDTYYKTDRSPGNVPQPSQAFHNEKGNCKVELKAPDYTDKARDPGVPTTMYLKLDGKECFTMSGSSSGNWWNQTISHKLPSRLNKAGTGTINGIYVSENARPKQSIKVDLITQKWNGYGPSNVVAWLQPKKPLQDCMSFYIDIEANNDLNTGIIQ